MGRRYTLRRRADRMEDTRRRITEAAAALHGTVGPAQTTISAVAERAGVERLTVYRHFPDEAALFEACTAHWLAGHPPPELAVWARERDPQARLTLALKQLYGYYAGTAAMWERAYRDAPVVAALAAPMRRWQEYLAKARETLAVGWPVRGGRRQRLHAALGHALDFQAWASLTRQGASRATAVALMAGLVQAAVGGGRRVT